MQTVNIYFEIWKNSDLFDSSSDQTDTGYANIRRPQFFRIWLPWSSTLSTRGGGTGAVIQGRRRTPNGDGRRTVMDGGWKHFFESVRSKTNSDGRRYEFLKVDEGGSTNSYTPTHKWTQFKAGMWKDYVFGWMSHPTHVTSLEVKRYVLNLIL